VKRGGRVENQETRELKSGRCKKHFGKLIVGRISKKDAGFKKAEEQLEGPRCRDLENEERQEGGLSGDISSTPNKRANREEEN